MWLRTVRFIFKEGFSNFFRNKLMFFASCAIVMAALVVLGFFLLLIFNIEANVDGAMDGVPQVTLYCESELSDAEADELERELRAAAGEGAREFRRLTEDERNARAREQLEGEAYIFDELGYDFLPVTFIVRLDSPELVAAFVQTAEQLPAVESVTYSERTVSLASTVSNWIKLFGAVLVGFPILFAVFIVSNTIRMAVTERRGEIGIMRYIGATERMIRWPFIVEGMIIGIVGAALAFLLTGYGYRFLENSFNEALADFGFLKLIRVADMAPLLLGLYLLIGVGVCAFGSARSIRKYLLV